MEVDRRTKDLVLVQPADSAESEILVLREENGCVIVGSVKPVNDEVLIDETDSATFVDEESLKWM